MKTTFSSSNRGSAFITVMGFCALLLILIASILKYSSSERQLNGRAKLLLEARTGAEALSEYGISQVKKVLETNRTFTDSVWTTDNESSFTPDGPPGNFAGLVLNPPDTFWTGSHIIDASGSESEKPRMYVGKIMSAGGLMLIDPANPDNENDPLKGKWAFRYDLDIISRATATDTFAHRNLTSYMKQSFAVRAVPLFSNAVYYNMDMEVQPGPDLTITGSTHTNGRLFCRTNSGNTVSFAGPVTAVKGFWTNFYKSTGVNLMPYFQSITDSGSLQTNDEDTNVVRILQSGTSNYKTMRLSAATTGFTPNLPNGSWVESTWELRPTGETWQRHLGDDVPVTETVASKTNFANWIQQTFLGNLLTNVNGLTPNRIQGIPDYTYVYGSVYPDPITGTADSMYTYIQPTPPATTPVGNDVNNSAHALIETPRLTSAASYYKPTEDIKYSRRCGLYISANSTGITPAAGATNGHKPDGTPIRVAAHSYRAFKTDGTEVVLPGQNTFGDTNPAAAYVAIVNPYASHKNARPIVQIYNIDYDSASGTPNQEKATFRRMVDMRRTEGGNDTDATTRANTTFIHSTARGTTNKYIPKNLFMIDIDIMELKKAVRTIGVTVNTSVTTTNSDYYLTGIPPSDSNFNNFIYNPAATPINVTLDNTTRIITTNVTTLTSAFTSTDWNGGVYVESIAADLFDVTAGTNATAIALRKAKTHELHDSGVRLINGRGKVPSLTDTDRTGLTFATNDALYVLGSFNCDGKANTPVTVERLLPTVPGQSTGQYPDDGLDHNSSELPCSLVADAIYLLSQPNNTLVSGALGQDRGWNDAFSDLAKVTSSWSSTWATSAPSGSNLQEGDVLATGSERFPYKVPYDAAAGSWGGTTTKSRCKLQANVFSEYSFAMLCGLVPTGKNSYGQTSGGLHNFPRFLESWSGTTCRIRGSMVALFECRIAEDPWNLRTYDPPTRIWGFNLVFADGVMPPLTPKTVQIRRVGTNDIRKAEFDQKVSDWGY